MLKKYSAFIIILTLSIVSVAISNHGKKTSETLQDTITKLEVAYDIKIEEFSLKIEDGEVRISDVALKDGRRLNSEDLFRLENSILNELSISEPGI